MTERMHNTDRPAPEIVVEHGRVFADAMVTHPDYARVLLEWSTALREEVWPLYLQFHENNIRIIARTIKSAAQFRKLPVVFLLHEGGPAFP